MFDLRNYIPFWQKKKNRLGFELSKYQHNLKRNFLYYGLGITLLTFLLVISKTCNWSNPELRKKSKLEAVKTQVPELNFKQIIPEPDIKNLTMIGEVYRSGIRGDRLQGAILRSLRFQNITKKVEARYNLPNNLLLAMVMQESMGVDLLPNSGDDGGLGLCHMQPSTASEFNLKILDNCTDLRNFKHGRKLRGLIQKHQFDKRQLLQYDDRFHPILNLDAAGRMLWYYMHGNQFKQTPVRTGIYRYAGYKNYNSYYKRVEYYRGLLNDPKVVNEVRKEFNKINTNLTINGKKGDFDLYIQTHQNQQKNYGLDDY